MIRQDARGRSIAIVPDLIVNPGSALYGSRPRLSSDYGDSLVELGWGLMKLPPHLLPEATVESAIELAAGDSVDYLQHGYAVVVVAFDDIPQGGVWLPRLERAFGALSTTLPPVIKIRSVDEPHRSALQHFRDALAAHAPTSTAQQPG